MISAKQLQYLPVHSISQRGKDDLFSVASGNIICGFIGCGSLKSEGFGDGYTVLGALPSPSCA